ncbi:pyridoxamine 5'-phosphate oxidase family protein [Campylobacter jejuni]|uniref:pyridoxamine 5'-phosphate oxidase family protein n=1 Tax=Campylobacter jejuni TaxID=197 RepID=UPI0035587C7A
MTNVEKISEFLTQAKVFTFLTVDNGQPKGRPFGFHLVDGDRIYFGTGTFKNCFKQRRWRSYLLRNRHLQELLQAT